MTYGTPRSAAISGMDAAGYTESVDPKATTKSASAAADAARSRSFERSGWPKLIVAGLRTPPQAHRGGRHACAGDDQDAPRRLQVLNEPRVDHSVSSFRPERDDRIDVQNPARRQVARKRRRGQ